MNLGFNPQSYHSIFPIYLYDGKETRENLQTMLAPLNVDIKHMREEHTLGGLAGDKVASCDFSLVADYFALVKVLRPAKGERMDDGTAAEGCTCAFCGARRCKKTGWADGNIVSNVWDGIDIDEDALEGCILDIPLHKISFCFLHAKVRIVGSLLNKLLRQSDMKKKCPELQANLREIIPTFKITLKGELTTKGKPAKGAKASALQGEQVDKILACVRAASKEESMRSPEEKKLSEKWLAVIGSGDPFLTIRKLKPTW